MMVDNDVIRYYESIESRLGYRYMLGGAKHFGFYDPSNPDVSFSSAIKNMERYLAHKVDLPPGSVVLDAGCGEGVVALRLADQCGVCVRGVDLLSWNIDRARRRADRSRVGERVQFDVMDYACLAVDDGTFDAVYTMETLVHAPDHMAALREFARVLKPGGKLVLFEYSVPRMDRLSRAARDALGAVVRGSAMHSLPRFLHDSFPVHLAAAGFVDVEVEDITKNVLPMLRRFARIARLPYLVLKTFGLQHRVINAMAAVELNRYPEAWRYNVVTAKKPKTLSV